MSIFSKKDQQSGYIALLTVMVLGVVVTAIASSLILLGLGHVRTSLSESQSANARLAADACIEAALKQIKLASSYTGTDNLNLDDSSGSYTVSSNTIDSIIAVGISGDSTRRVSVDLSSRSPTIVFTRWREY